LIQFIFSALLLSAMTLLKRNFKQKNDWTCGPAVARLVLHAFGHKKPLREVSKALKTDRNGTANAYMIRLFKRNRLKIKVKNGTGISDLKKHTKKHLVVVAYSIPSSGDSHYSIVRKVSHGRVYFHDTWFGSKHSYNINYFLKNWHDDEATRWMLAVKKPTR
jgi:ABC-type bacteriocin/lantibiotic exporter with double-glycine peptidase domain